MKMRMRMKMKNEERNVEFILFYYPIYGRNYYTIQLRICASYENSISAKIENTFGLIFLDIG